MNTRKDMVEYAITGIILIVILTMHSWLPLLTGSNTPMAVVRGNSMYPLFRTGDLVILVKKKPEEINPGDIVVYKSKSGGYIIHRVVSVCESEGSYYYRIWGDNNPIEDRYQYDVERGSCTGISYSRIVGVVWSPTGSSFKIPYIGLLSFRH